MKENAQCDIFVKKKIDTRLDNRAQQCGTVASNNSNNF